MYSNQTYEVIKDRILNDENIKKTELAVNEGSITNSIVSALSVEEAKLYIDMMNLFRLAFIEEGFYDYLDKRVNEFGIYRKEGEFATGEVEFKGTVGTRIDNGSIIRINGLDYSVIKDITISEVIEDNKSPIQANGVGSNYNVPINSIFTIAEEITGLESIVATTEIEGGIDKETDEELRTRFYETQRNNATSGNVAHYEQWAKEVDGVYNAKVTPLWNGAGTVKVAIAGRNNKPVDEEIIEKCKAYIEEVRPIGATVTVVTPSELKINIAANITLNSAYSKEQAEAEVLTKLEEYLLTVTDKVLYSNIFAMLVNCDSIVDCTEVKINNQTSNINISAEQVATTGTITLNGVI